MNLTTTAGRYLCAAEAEPVTDVHPLGKPINRPQDQPKPQPVERWVPATEKGYERSTTTGAIRQKACMSAPGLYLESGEFVPAEQINAQPAEKRLPRTLDELDATEWFDEEDTYSRLVELRGGCRCRDCPPCSACSDPITEQEAVQLGLMEPAQPADSGEVPSVDDVRSAWFALLARGVHALRAFAAVDPLIGDAKEAQFAKGFSFSVIEDTPADRRAEVIAALNQLGS